MPGSEPNDISADDITRANLRGLAVWLMRVAIEVLLLALIWILINILLVLALKNR